MLGPSTQLLRSLKAGVLGRVSTHRFWAESLGLEDGVDHVALTDMGGLCVQTWHLDDFLAST